MKLKTFLTVIFLCFISCKREETQEKNEIDTNTSIFQGWVFKSIKGSKLRFENEKIIDTKIHELKYIGKVDRLKKPPYFILSGRDCSGCDANISIYIYSPTEGEMDIAHGKNRYQFPGILKDYETEKPLYKSRAFYGEVTDNTQGIIWYQEIFNENGQIEKNTFLIRLEDNKKSVLIEGQESFPQTLKLLQEKKCSEISGQSLTSEP